MAESRLAWGEALPIVGRELRVAAKRRATYRLRWIVALLGGLEVFIAAFGAGGSVQAGRFVFWCTATIMTIICAAAGLLLTSDSISREKREGTLGLLYLTRLAPADVVLGKLAAGSLSGLAIAFAGMPFLAFSLCLGGVTAREFWVMDAALLFLLAYSLTLGIFLSTLFRKESVVSLLFCLAMLLPLTAAPLAIMKWKTLPPFLARVNPFFSIASLLDDRGTFFGQESVLSVLLWQGFAMIAMILTSCLLLPSTIRARGTTERREVRISSRRLLRKRGGMDKNPVLWWSQRLGHTLALLLLCVGLYLVVGFASRDREEAQITFVLIMAFLPKLFVLWHASGVMAIERQTGFLETLLTTPLSGGEILRAKMSAIKRQIAPALIFAMLALWATSTDWWGTEGQITNGATLVLAAMLTLLVDVHMVGWVGLWQGVVARDRRRALIWSALWGFVGPWIPAVAGFFFFEFLFDLDLLKEPVLVVSLAIISANIVSVGIGCFALVRLHEKFRSTATQSWAGRKQYSA
jgi:ABC-type transport system involved in multi-copper enzyme maturation permease subunit